jgi:catechol 2,3-dioxygenase-like lactoylglutathione lyase family enzyme
MTLGNFSVSLAVKDLAASRSLYQKLGFEARFGDGKGWLILQRGATIGLFQGAFERNLLTFPGWDAAGKKLLHDVREIQRRARRRDRAGERGRRDDHRAGEHDRSRPRRQLDPVRTSV